MGNHGGGGHAYAGGVSRRTSACLYSDIHVNGCNDADAVDACLLYGNTASVRAHDMLQTFQSNHSNFKPSACGLRREAASVARQEPGLSNLPLIGCP